MEVDEGGKEGGRDLLVVASELAMMRMCTQSEIFDGRRRCLMRISDWVVKFLTQEVKFEDLKLSGGLVLMMRPLCVCSF